MTGLRAGSTPGYVHFGDVARELCKDQCQYISRYVRGNDRTPALGAGLRILGDPADYHNLEIHEDDVAVFVQRVLQHRRVEG